MSGFFITKIHLISLYNAETSKVREQQHFWLSHGAQETVRFTQALQQIIDET